MSEQPILIWGAGAIGGTVGAYLAHAGHKVTFVDRDRDHVGAMRKRGFTITGPIAEFTIEADAKDPGEIQGTFDTVLLCVKAQDTAAATMQLSSHLGPNGFVVSLQNGLNEVEIATIVGPRRTVGAFVNFDADYLSPGVVQYAGHGAVVVGEIDGKLTARLRSLHQTLLAFDRYAKLSSNIYGFLWSKLAYAALLFATALTNESIGDCLALPQYRNVFVLLTREVLNTAAAEGIKCEPFDGFDPTAFLDVRHVDRAEASLAQLVDHNRYSTKKRSGIWRDIAVRKRHTEVDAQLGAVVRYAKKRGLQVPVTLRLIQLIHEIERGTRVQSLSTLAALAEVV